MADQRLDMVEQLHIALYGATWARPETPEQVWHLLLKEVRRLRVGTVLAAELQHDEHGPHRFTDEQSGTYPDEACLYRRYLPRGAGEDPPNPGPFCGRRRKHPIHGTD